MSGHRSACVTRLPCTPSVHAPNLVSPFSLHCLYFYSLSFPSVPSPCATCAPFIDTTHRAQQHAASTPLFWPHISKTQISLESLESLRHLGVILESWVALVEEIIFSPKITPRLVRDYFFSKITPRVVRNFFPPQDHTKTVRDYHYFQDQTKTVGKNSQVPYKHESIKQSRIIDMYVVT